MSADLQILTEELLAHLGAAKMQIIPNDDQIIAGHIHAAHALALVLFREARAFKPLWPSQVAA